MNRKEPFSEQLREAVRHSDKTRYRIAQETGIAASILARFVNDGAGLSLGSIDLLCDCLGLGLSVPKASRAKTIKQTKTARKGK